MSTPDQITVSPSRRGFLAGVWAALPVLLAVAPFGLIFGTLAAEAGFDLAQTMAFTSLVVAGASQLAALQLLSDGAPAIVAIITGAVVNLRMAMYSAAIAVHWQGLGMAWRIPAAFFLHDQAFALSLNRYRAHPGESVADRAGFYFGIGATTVTVWIAASWLGAEIGARIPEGWGLDFAAPACFIGVAAPMIRGTANVVAALTASVLAVLLAGLPGGAGLLVAAAAGIAAGMAAGRRVARRAAPVMEPAE
ncbi:AzlC family ABC transporter permease [Limibaculum sp. FT325]|uniref:AzlC family ABC transporter permease n=1 Tax=Thermohalobaculum sediminis TaxID=2939436 RepID=UPI0020C0C939|nr:AzlC family ABC transporter permease [Limibaculum sediminis]MCL5778182.1 AzlC family ABC transporter permease [Limibaculum sediminis]